MSVLGVSMKLLLLSLGLVNAFSIPHAESPEARSPQPLSFNIVPSESGSTIERYKREVAYISAKYGVKPPGYHLLPRAGPGTSNSAYAPFTMTLNIGGQPVHVRPDTGSGFFWVPSAKVANNIPAPNSWDPSKSSTSSCIQNSNWTVQYYAATVDSSGIVCTDNIYWNNVGSAATDYKETVMLATISAQTQIYGILGLSHDKVVNYKVNNVPTTAPTFFQHLIPTLPQPLFTIDYKLAGNGTLDFGFIDPAKKTGNVTYAPMRIPNTWQASAKGVIIAASKNSYINTTRDVPFDVDTGSVINYMDADLVARFWSSVDNSTYSSCCGWIYPCAATPPTLVFYINGKSVVTPGRYFNYGAIGNGSCIGGLQNTLWSNALLGKPTISSNLVVFLNSSSDYPNGAVGFASKNITSD